MRIVASHRSLPMRLSSLARLASALLLALPCSHTATAQVLHDNGPLVTTQDNGAGGADTSAVQAGVGQTVTGYAASPVGITRVADDVTVPASGWLLSGIRLFAFQSGATPADLGVDGVRVRIWDALPEQPGSTLVFDSTTLAPSPTSVVSAGLYRVVGARVSDTRRPVARIDVQTGPRVLHGGTYWIDWQVTGTQAAGPYVPPVTRVGQAGSGNARQLRGTAWSAIEGTGTGEELPFLLLGGELPDAIFSDSFES